MGPHFDTFRLSRALKGLAKLGKHNVSLAKHPILLKHLHAWIPLLRMTAKDDIMFKAATDLGFQGLCRKSEYTHKGRVWNPDTSTTRADVEFFPSMENPERMEVSLPPTKNDPLGQNRTPIVL